jgi:hypothetical protein
VVYAELEQSTNRTERIEIISDEEAAKFADMKLLKTPVDTEIKI